MTTAQPCASDPVLQRRSIAWLLRAMAESIWRRRVAWTVVIGAFTVFHCHFAIAVNMTYSLPQQMFLIAKGVFPERGDYAVFYWNGGGPYSRGSTFVKILAGVPGDLVTRHERDFYVNGRLIGTAKTHSKRGEPLEYGETGVLGKDQFFVAGVHKDSFDSRYALVGWISRERIKGTAYALF